MAQSPTPYMKLKQEAQSNVPRAPNARTQSSVPSISNVEIPAATLPPTLNIHNMGKLLSPTKGRGFIAQIQSSSLPPKLGTNSSNQYDQLKINETKRRLFCIQKEKFIKLREAKLKTAEMKWIPTLQSVLRAREEDVRQINEEFAQQMQFLQQIEFDFDRSNNGNQGNGPVNSTNAVAMQPTRQRSTTYPPHGSVNEKQISPIFQVSAKSPMFVNPETKSAEQKKDEPENGNNKQPPKRPKTMKDLLQMAVEEDSYDSDSEATDTESTSSPMPYRIRGMDEYLRQLDLSRVRAVDGGYQCPVLNCTKVLSRRYDVKRHIRLKHSETTEESHPFGCPQPNCGQRFTLRHHINEHVNAVHLKLKPFTCPVCKKPFARERDITKHCKRQHPEYEQRNPKEEDGDHDMNDE